LTISLPEYYCFPIPGLPPAWELPLREENALGADGDEVVRVIEEMVRVTNTHDLDACLEFYSDDAEVQDPRFPEPVRGIEYVREGFGYWLDAFPDVQVTINKLIVDPPDIAVEWTFEGTHKGEYMGVRPSGQRFRVMTAAHFTVEHGKVTRDFSLFDVTGIRQLEELAQTAKSG
jgi:steroid delta-isomerase-like uncharacterized protein